jgi:GNAT superfamily N-acetyltransferase
MWFRMGAVEIRRMQTGDSTQLAYLTSLAFQNHPMFEAIFQSNGEELRKIIEQDFLDMYENWPHETFVAINNGKIIGGIRSGSCTGNWHSGFSYSEGEYEYIISHKIEELTTLQREKWLEITCESHDIGIPHSHVGPIVVLPEFQGKGVGSKLMEDYFARLNGCVSFLETFSESNVRFYGNHGYRLVATDFILGIKGYWLIRD